MGPENFYKTGAGERAQVSVTILPSSGGVVKILSLTSAFPELCFRSLGTTPTSAKTLSEWKGHSRSSRKVPGHSQSNSRNSETVSILGVASHDLSNTKPQFSEPLPDRFSELMGTPTWKIFICPSILGAFFKNCDGPHAQECFSLFLGLPSLQKCVCEVVWRNLI